jgi:predicted nucleic acid-binding protein
VIFVDSSFWIGLSVPRDSRHPDAARLIRAHADTPLVTSNHVRGETWTYLNRRVGHRGGVRFLDRLEQTRRLSIRFIDEEIEAQALRWLRRHGEREYSFVDATSFALMRLLRIRRALAFDGDFAAAGFEELRPAAP